jgi:hypothetical protein
MEAEPLIEQLRHSTVRVYLPHQMGHGTGFFVGAGLVLTCAHVLVRDLKCGLGDRVYLAWQGVVDEPPWEAIVRKLLEDVDVALLELTTPLAAVSQPPAIDWDVAAARVGDELFVYGYSDQTPQGEPATFEVVGRTGEGLLKFKEGNARPGMSGSPLLNLRTGRLCGMMKRTLGQGSDLGGEGVPAGVILERLPQLAPREPRVAPNPFGDEGCITDPDRLWGRDELLRQLFEVLDKGGNRSLIGPEGTGKSSLLRMVSVLGPEKMRRPIDRFIHLDLHLIRDGKTFWEVLCEELGLDGPLHGHRLERALRGKRFVVCLDEIARMTDTARFSGEDSEELRGLADGDHLPLSLVIAAQRPLGELFPDESGRTSPLAGICHGIEVAVFGLGEARRFVADRLLRTGVEFKPEQFDRLWDESKGNPKRLQRAAAELYDEQGGVRFDSRSQLG